MLINSDRVDSGREKEENKQTNNTAVDTSFVLLIGIIVTLVKWVSENGLLIICFFFGFVYRIYVYNLPRADPYFTHCIRCIDDTLFWAQSYGIFQSISTVYNQIWLKDDKTIST